jgi:hypothetical protein
MVAWEREGESEQRTAERSPHVDAPRQLQRCPAILTDEGRGGEGRGRNTQHATHQRVLQPRQHSSRHSSRTRRQFAKPPSLREPARTPARRPAALSADPPALLADPPALLAGPPALLAAQTDPHTDLHTNTHPASHSHQHHRHPASTPPTRTHRHNTPLTQRHPLHHHRHYHHHHHHHPSTPRTCVPFPQ